MIIGGGIVGANAARLAMGMRATVTLLDNNIAKLRQLDTEFQGRVSLVYATQESIENAVLAADLVIGAVLVRASKAPHLVSREMISRMKQGAAVVDVAIDQGGCIATSRPTTHDNPTYVVDGVVHYCVANMPGAVALTATQALNNATLPFILRLAKNGRQALLDDPHFLNGVHTTQGALCIREVADVLELPYQSFHDAIS